MLKVFLWPGDRLCDAFGLEPDTANRQVLRSFFNTMIWAAIAIGITLKLAI
jgi:hypothetical protein